MIRKAVIINNDRNSGDKNILSGNSCDVVKVKEFLCSPCGGAWSEDDVYATEPNAFTSESLFKFLSDINRKSCVDYWMIIFTGHGGSLDNGSNHDLIQLSPGNILAVEALKSWFRDTKSMIILDSCRTVAMITEAEYIGPFPTLIPKSGDTRYYFECKRLYEEHLAVLQDKCQCIAYSCGEREKSKSLPEGSLYLGSLIEKASVLINDCNIIRNTQSSFAKERIFSFKDIHSMAYDMVVKLSGGIQHPTYDGASEFPPFVVIPGFIDKP